MQLKYFLGATLTVLLLDSATASAELTAAQARYDTDGNGELSRAEAPPAVLRHFDRTDANNSGGLDQGELDRLARQLTAPRKDEEKSHAALETWLSDQPIGYASIDAYMNKLVNELPLEGTGLFVARDGAVKYQNTWGIYSPDTVIPIASASKWLTAAAIMTVVDEGRLDLDTPISEYWPEARGEAGTMTLRTMLSHTAGTGGSHLADQPRTFTLEASARAALALPRVGKPGEKFQYGGVSLQIAGYIAERVTGRPWADLFQQRIAGPLGMSNTWYGFARVPEPRQNITNPILAAGVYSTLEDYSHFLLMMAGSGVYDGKRILSAGAIDEMMRDYSNSTARLGANTNATTTRGYGLGAWCNEINPKGDCPVVQSGGAFGTAPSIDRRTNTVVLIMTKDRMPMVRPYWGQIIMAVNRISGGNESGGNETDRDGALAAYWRFFDNFNSQSPSTWTDALHFPHVRVSARGRAAVIEKPDQHTKQFDFEQIKKTGWDHSVGAEPEVLHVSPRKVHIKGGWTRYTKDNEPMFTNHVTYVLTKVGDRWAMQSRFGVDPGPGGPSDEHVEQGLAVVRSAFDAMGSNNAALAEHFNFPHFIIEPGRIVTIENSDALAEHKPSEATELTDVRAVQSGPSSMSVAFTAKTGSRSYQGILMVTQRDGHWGIESQSTIEN